MKKLKYQSAFIDLANASVKDIVQTVEVNLDQSYNSVIGIWVKPDSNGGATRIDINLFDNNGIEVMEPSDSKLWGADSNVKPEDQFVPVLFEIAKNRKMKVGATPRGNNLTSAVQVEAVFLLSNELIKIES